MRNIIFVNALVVLQNNIMLTTISENLRRSLKVTSKQAITFAEIYVSVN